MSARDPRHVPHIFGTLEVRSEADGGGPTCTVRSNTPETELRLSIASIAHAYGWIVEEEVPVHDGGRIDIVLYDGDRPHHLIELKLDLTKRARVRRAIQQIDGYGRWWAHKGGKPASTHLVGLTVDLPMAVGMADAYPSVNVFSVEQLLYGLRIWGDPCGRRFRRIVAAQRLADLQRVSGAYRAAIADLDEDLLPASAVPA